MDTVAVSEPSQFWTIVTAIATAVQAIVVLVSIVYLRKQLAFAAAEIKDIRVIHADGKQAQKVQHTIEFMRQWNSNTRPHLDVLFLHFPKLNKPDRNYLYQTSPWHIDPVEATAIHDAVGVPSNEGERQRQEIRKALIHLFNHFESMALACSNHLVLEEELKKAAGQIIVELWIYFQPFVLIWPNTHHREGWPPLRPVVEEWRRHLLKEYNKRNERNDEPETEFDNELVV